MRNRIRVYAQLLNFFSCFAVIRTSGRIGEKKFRLTLGSVPFDRDHDGGANQNAVFSFLRGNDSTLFNAETPSQFGGDHDCAPLPHFRRFHVYLPSEVSEYQYAR
jgi:hypothetical protein